MGFTHKSALKQHYVFSEDKWTEGAHVCLVDANSTIVRKLLTGGDLAGLVANIRGFAQPYYHATAVGRDVELHFDSGAPPAKRETQARRDAQDGGLGDRLPPEVMNPAAWTSPADFETTLIAAHAAAGKPRPDATAAQRFNAAVGAAWRVRPLRRELLGAVPTLLDAPPGVQFLLSGVSVPRGTPAERWRRGENRVGRYEDPGAPRFYGVADTQIARGDAETVAIEWAAEAGSPTLRQLAPADCGEGEVAVQLALRRHIGLAHAREMVRGAADPTRILLVSTDSDTMMRALLEVERASTLLSAVDIRLSESDPGEPDAPCVDVIATYRRLRESAPNVARPAEMLCALLCLGGCDYTSGIYGFGDAAIFRALGADRDSFVKNAAAGAHVLIARAVHEAEERAASPQKRAKIAAPRLPGENLGPIVEWCIRYYIDPKNAPDATELWAAK